MTFELKSKNRRITKSRDIAKRDALILSLTKNGWTSAEIGKHPELNFAVHNSQCQRVIQIQRELVDQGKLTKLDNGSFDIPVQKVTAHRWELVELEIAKSQVDELKKVHAYLIDNGRQDKGISDIINSLVVVCNTVNIHPNQIVNAVTLDGKENYLEKASDVMKQFKQKMTSHEVVYNRSTNNAGSVMKLEINTNRYRNALRMLLLAHNKHIPKLPKSHILSGTKGNLFGAYNGIGMTDKETMECINFVEKNGKDILGTKRWDFGYVAMVALMPETLGRTNALAHWTVNYQTEHDEFEHQTVEYDFIQGFAEKKTMKSRPQGWDKFVIHPTVRQKLHQIAEYRKGKTLVEFNQSKAYGSKTVETSINELMKNFYIEKGWLPQDCLKTLADRNQSSIFAKGTKQFFLDNSSAYVLRHTGAHMWCRRTKYDYGFVAELGWSDINTLRDCYAGMDLKSRLKENDCFYCKPPTNPELMSNQIFCSATHAFIYYSNGMKAKQGGQTP